MLNLRAVIVVVAAVVGDGEGEVVVEEFVVSRVRKPLNKTMQGMANN